VEQARVEAIGAGRMKGVRGNLSAMLEDKYHRGNFEEITDKADAPLEDAVALMVREKLAGMPVPKSAEKIVDIWRKDVEAKAGKDLKSLADTVDDQEGFARALRDLLVSLDMADELAYKVYTTKFDEEVEGRGTLRCAGADRLRAFLDKQLPAPCRALSPGSPTGCSAA
jgi:cobalamin biosynthesis protein CobT